VARPNTGKRIHAFLFSLLAFFVSKYRLKCKGLSATNSYRTTTKRDNMALRNWNIETVPAVHADSIDSLIGNTPLLGFRRRCSPKPNGRIRAAA
jgi:hypothetical protein